MSINPPNNFPAPWAIAWGEDTYGFWQAFEIKGIQQILRWIPPGHFKMGSPDDEAEREDNEQQHDVIIKHGFWLSDTACTQALWQAVMGDNPSDFSHNKQNPVESISWDDCQVFIENLNEILSVNFLRLPSEAEWEYSCRAGTTTPFSFGKTITTDQANYAVNYPYLRNKAEYKKGEYRKNTLPVVTFPPNPWGLYQMHGNVYEWCKGVYRADYSVGGAGAGSQRVLRGGSWINDARGLRSAYRHANQPDFRSRIIGLRLAGGFDSTGRQ